MTPNQTTFTDAAALAREKAAGLGRSAADKIDANRRNAAERLYSAASALHNKADSLPGGDKVSAFAHKTANKLRYAGDYVITNDSDRMMGDVQRLVRANPGPSLAAAAALGFLVGRCFKSDD